MTLREMCESIGIDDEPMECAFAIAAFMRSAVQREPSTFEGECASLLKVHALVGRVDTPETIRKLLELLGRIPDMEVPDRFWLAISEADRDEEE